MEKFLTALSGKEPVPGGGGAAALIGSVSAALCSMVANLTTGKKKYAQYQEDIDRILAYLETAIWEIEEYIEKDAKAFAPLAQAYSIPKEQPDREEILEKASLNAAVIPLELTQKLYALIPIIEELELKGSTLAISDVAVAAVACKAAIESSVMNVFINTKSLQNKEVADGLNEKALQLSTDGAKRCQDIYDRIQKVLVS